RLAFMPLLYVIIPITLLIVELDRYLGLNGMIPNEPFLLTVHVSNDEILNEVSLELPPQVTVTAPPVHVPTAREVIWRLSASNAGAYALKIVSAGQTVTKNLYVSANIARLSPARLRGHFWRRMFTSTEPALPDNLPIDSVTINYPERNIDLFGVY